MKKLTPKMMVLKRYPRAFAFCEMNEWKIFRDRYDYDQYGGTLTAWSDSAREAWAAAARNLKRG